MARDKAQDRYTYQFVISKDLHERLAMLRKRFPSLPPLAPMLRQATEDYVEMFDEVLTALEQGKPTAEVEAQLHSALGRLILRETSKISAIQSPRKEVEGRKIEKKKARS